MAYETCAIDFLKLPLEECLTHSTPVKFKDEEVKECERYLEATLLFPPSMQPKVEDLKSCQPTSPPEEPPKLELKPLSSNLRNKETKEIFNGYTVAPQGKYSIKNQGSISSPFSFFYLVFLPFSH